MQGYLFITPNVTEHHSKRVVFFVRRFLDGVHLPWKKFDCGLTLKGHRIHVKFVPAYSFLRLSFPPPIPLCDVVKFPPSLGLTHVCDLSDAPRPAPLPPYYTPPFVRFFFCPQPRLRVRSFPLVFRRSTRGKVPFMSLHLGDALGRLTVFLGLV